MRVTAQEVRDITDTDLESDVIERHILAANSRVNEIKENDPSIGEPKLEVIELYYAAHVLTTQDPQVSTEALGSGEWDYDLTEYLEIAISLDPTGTLDPDEGDPANFHVFDGR